jgi:hypothetical protein
MVRINYLCLFLFLVAIAAGQYTSGIEGTVADQSGAAIASARVTVVNEATQVDRETTTNVNGYFRVLDLAPGMYRVQVLLSGFQNWTQAGIQLDGNQLRTCIPNCSSASKEPRSKSHPPSEPSKSARVRWPAAPPSRRWK